MTKDNDVEEIPAAALSLVSTLASQMRELGAKIERAESELMKLKTDYQEIEVRRLPDAMADIGFTEFTLATGEKLTVGPEYHASIPAAKKTEAYAWLREHEFGDLIKSLLAVEFGKGEAEVAEAVRQQLTEAMPERPVVLNDSIHSATLKALVKEQFEAGDPLPEELFGVFIINRAKIKQPKRRA